MRPSSSGDYCLFVVFEADVRATGRVIVKPASVAEYIRYRILSRNVPRLMMCNVEGPPTAVDVTSLARTLEAFAQLGQEYLYYRVYNAIHVTVDLAFLVAGIYACAGERTRRFRGRPVNSNQEPPRGSSAKPRPRRGEPGWVSVDAEAINHRIDVREIEQHLPHLRPFTERGFRETGSMPVRNLLHFLAAQLRTAYSYRDAVGRDRKA